jgi:anti-sigma B factor antagonist
MIDSSGMGTLVGNARSVASHNGSITLVGLTPRVRRMLAVTNLERYFDIPEEAGEVLEEEEACALGHGSS